jgi:hypothetical protein
MRRSVAVLVLGCSLALGALACQARHEPPAPAPSSLPAPPVPPASSRPDALVAIEKGLQAAKLRPPARRAHEPRLAFGKGVFARLGEGALEVYDDESFLPLASVPLEAPRALLTLADGALLAVGGRGLLRWERGKRNVTLLPRPVLLPGCELFADAREPERFWVFEPQAAPPKLSSFRIPAAGQTVGLLLAEQTIELSSPRGGVVGATREGVWLYLTAGRAERFGPGGAKLAALDLGNAPLPMWALPTQRLDQSLWLDAAGSVSRVLVSPRFKPLTSERLVGTPFSVGVGDEGRLLAVVEVTGEGPRFELELFDSKPSLRARVPLPGEAPTGDDDWVRVVTRNQEVAVASRRSRVAVGGPERFRIFDNAGNVIFSIPSM